MFSSIRTLCTICCRVRQFWGFNGCYCFRMKLSARACRACRSGVEKRRVLIISGNLSLPSHRRHIFIVRSERNVGTSLNVAFCRYWWGMAMPYSGYSAIPLPPGQSIEPFVRCEHFVNWKCPRVLKKHERTPWASILFVRLKMFLCCCAH